MLTDITLRLTWREFECLEYGIRCAINTRLEEGEIAESFRLTQLLAIIKPEDEKAAEFAAIAEASIGPLNSAQGQYVRRNARTA